MTYGKPEISSLGYVLEVIESIPSKTVHNLESNQTTGDPAYDLDD